jgi:hypothetical protein
MENVNNQWLDLYSGVVDQKTSINPVPIPPAAGSKNDGVATLDKPRSIAANISQPENNLYTINDRDIKILRDAASSSNRIDNLDLRGVINKAEATYPGGLKELIEHVNKQYGDKLVFIGDKDIETLRNGTDIAKMHEILERANKQAIGIQQLTMKLESSEPKLPHIFMDYAKRRFEIREEYHPFAASLFPYSFHGTQSKSLPEIKNILDTCTETGQQEGLLSYTSPKGKSFLTLALAGEKNKDKPGIFDNTALKYLLEKATEKLTEGELQRILLQSTEKGNPFVIAVRQNNIEAAGLILDTAEKHLSPENLKITMERMLLTHDKWYMPLRKALENGSDELVTLILDKAEKYLSSDKLKEMFTWTEPSLGGGRNNIVACGILERLIDEKVYNKLGSEAYEKAHDGQFTLVGRVLDSKAAEILEPDVIKEILNDALGKFRKVPGLFLGEKSFKPIYERLELLNSKS